MTTLARVVLELADRPWSELDAGERSSFAAWLERARGEDLYLLLREARSRWKRPRQSSSQTLAAIRLAKAPPEET